MLLYLIIVVEVDPPAKAVNRLSPLIGKSHDDSTAFCIVFLYTHGHDRSLPRNTKFLVDLMLNGQPVRIPPETPLNMVALH